MRTRNDTIFCPRSKRNFVLTASLVVALGGGVLPATAFADGGDLQLGGSTSQDVQSQDNGTPSDDAPSDDAPSDDAPSDDAPSDDAPSDDALANDAMASDATTGGQVGEGAVEDPRTDLERAEDDLAQKTEARDSAKTDLDKAQETLDGVNEEIQNDVATVHDDAQAKLDGAQDAFEEAKGASDEAKAESDVARKGLEDAQARVDEVAQDQQEAWERVDSAWGDVQEGQQKYSDAMTRRNELAVAEQEAMIADVSSPDEVEAQKKAYTDALEKEREAARAAYGDSSDRGAQGAFDDACDEARTVFIGDRDPSQVSEDELRPLTDFIQSVVMLVEKPIIRDEENGTSYVRLSLLDPEFDAMYGRGTQKRQREFADAIAKTESDIADLKNKSTSLEADSIQLAKDAESLERAVELAEKSYAERVDAHTKAMNAVQDARERYQNAQEALDGATPAMLARLEAEATASLDALEAAIEASDEAYREVSKAGDELVTLQIEQNQVKWQIGVVEARLSEAERGLASLERDLEEYTKTKTDIDGWLEQSEKSIKLAKKIVEEAKRDYDDASQALMEATANDPAKRAAASKLISAASTFLGAAEAFAPASAALKEAEISMWPYAEYGEKSDDEKFTTENMLAGADAYVAKYETWQEAIKAVREAEQLLGELDEDNGRLSAAYDEAVREATQVNLSLGEAWGAAEIAQGRARVAAAKNEVLRQALDDAASELDAAKAAYERAVEVTEDKVRAGGITDEGYAYLNDYKIVYDEAKAAYDEAKAAYDEAKAAYDESYAAYRRTWDAAQPREEREQTRDIVNNHEIASKRFAGLDDSGSTSDREPASEQVAQTGKLSSSVTKIQTPEAKSQQTVAAQRSLTQTIESATSKVKVEGAVGGEIKVKSDPVMSEVADGVYEVESMPEVDVKALVANDPAHTAEDINELWWCVYVNGVKVRIMNALGQHAPGIVRVVWADSADLAQASLAGVDFGDGTVIVLTSDTELALDVVWA